MPGIYFNRYVTSDYMHFDYFISIETFRRYAIKSTPFDYKHFVAPRLNQIPF